MAESTSAHAHPQPESVDHQSLEARLGYTFANSGLLRDALTHRSFVHETNDPGTVSNERLEYLGDAVLQLVSASLLYTEFPDSPEGELSTLRAALVRASALAHFARMLNLGEGLRLGRGEAATGGRDRDLLIASAFEAVVGALYLDAGFTVATQIVQPLLRSQLQKLRSQGRLKDDKSTLQERAQAQLGLTPTYRLIEESGPSHKRTFVVEVMIGDLVAGRGEGLSKRQAEQAAAAQAVADEGWAGASGRSLDTHGTEP